MATHIEVFVTKNQKIRARITESHRSFEPGTNKVTEVTIGGKRWNSGEFWEHKERILRHVDSLIDYLTSQKFEHLTDI